MYQISLGTYLDKVMGGWYGKCLGGTVGCFEGTKRITRLAVRDLLPEKMLPNDDLDVQLIWMDVLLSKGIHFTSDHLMEAWLAEYPYNFGEYSIARRNYRRGVHAPESGIYSNQFFCDSMGCPIRSDIWGLTAPGNPALAAANAQKDGILDHSGESIWSEQFLAAMTAQAFFESDIRTLIDTQLHFLPEHSVTHSCVRLAIEQFDAGMPWEKTWGALRDGYGRPDCTYAPINLGFLVMALLHGAGNIEKTLAITLNAGWDVDCTCSSSAALLGVICGYGGFEDQWRAHVGETIATLASPVHPMDNLHTLSHYTLQAAWTWIKEGVNQTVMITDIPDTLQPIPTCVYATPITLQTDYCGNPAISAYTPKHMKLLVCSDSLRNCNIQIRFSEIPKALTLDCSQTEVHLDQRGRAVLPLQVKLAGGVYVLPDDNRFFVTAEADGKQLGELEFGLCGAPSVLVSPLYYDTYMDWLDLSSLPDSRFICSGEERVIAPELSEEYGNHRVDLDKSYLPENFSDAAQTKALFANACRGSVFEDILSIKDTYGFHGCACVYYYMEVHSPMARPADLFIGSSDPFKLWVNGTLVQQQTECKLWYPYQYIIGVDMQKGINTIVLKVARKGENNQYSLVFRERKTLFGFDSAPVLTDLSYTVL